MLASLHGSPQQSQGWDAFHPGTLNLSFPYGHIEPLKQWQPKAYAKRLEDVKPDKKKGASRMQVKREAQKAMLARCKSNNSAGQSFAMLPPPYAPLGFVGSSTGDGAQCDSLKRKYDQALPALDEQLSSKRSLVESAWPVELAGFAAGQSVWRLRGGGQAAQDEASEDPPAEGGTQNQAEAEGSQQAGQRVDALISEVASMMESAQRGGQASEVMLRLNRLESIPSLPRFNSLELADEMFADILKWDLPKGEERTVEVKEGEVGRTRGGGVESDDAQVEEFLKSLDPALANREPVAIQDQLQKSAAEGKDGAEGKQRAGARPVSVRGGAKDLGDAGENKSEGTASEQASQDQAAAGEGLKHSGSGEAAQPSKLQSAEAVPGKQSGGKPEVQPKQGPAISQKPMVRSPRAGEEKPRQLVRPSLDILAQASASFGPTSPVASKDSLESPESPILSSLGGGPRRPKLTPPQQEKLRGFAAKVHWNWGAAEGTGEARQLCAELGIDMRQMKRWVESHRPKDVAPPPPQAVPFMGWGVPPGVGMMNPAYMSYMAGSPMAFPGAWPGMPRPPLGDGSWGGGPPMGPMGQPFNPTMQAPFTQPLLGPSFPGPPFLPGGFASTGFGGGAPGGPLSAPAATPLNVDENQELVASAEALGKLLGDRVNTIPPEKLKEILAAWMAHKRNKREQETVPAAREAPLSGAGGTKRKEPEPLAHPPADEPSEGSLLQFSIPSLERGLSNAPSISTLLAEELASAAAEDGGLGKDGDGAPGGAFKGQGASRDPSLSVLLQEIGGAMEEAPKRTMGPLERQVFGVDEDNMQMGPAPESGDDESASSSDEPSERRPGLRPRSKRRRFAESSAEEEEEEPEEPQSEENEEPGVDEEVFPHDPEGRAEGGQWQLGTGLEDRRLPPPLGYQGHVGQTGIRAVLFEKALTASDTSHLGRWVLPKLAAERYMPYMEHRDGTFMLVEDSKGGRWCCKYRWWPNNKSKMYVLEQTGDIVKHFKLHPGDTIHFCQSVEGHLMIYEQKKNSKQRPPVASAASPAPLPKRYAKRVPIEPKPSPKGSRKQLKAPKAPRSPPPPKAAYKLPSPFARVSTRGRTIRPSSRLRRGGDGNPENGSPALVYNASAGQGLAGRLVSHEWRGSAMLSPGGSGNAASDTPEVGVDPWGADELLGRGEGTAQINELARHFLQQTNPGGAGRGGLSAGVPRPLARTGSADLANEILALTNSGREVGPRELSPLGAPSRQGSLTPVLQRTKSSESLPFSVSNFPPIPTGLESLSRSSSLNRTASLARAGSLLSRLPSDLEALSKMDNFPSFDFAATPPLPVESAFQPYGGTPGRQANAAVATAGDAAQNRRRAG